MNRSSKILFLKNPLFNNQIFIIVKILVITKITLIVCTCCQEKFYCYPIFLENWSWVRQSNYSTYSNSITSCQDSMGWWNSPRSITIISETRTHTSKSPTCIVFGPYTLFLDPNCKTDGRGTIKFISFKQKLENWIIVVGCWRAKRDWSLYPHCDINIDVIHGKLKLCEIDECVSSIAKISVHTSLRNNRYCSNSAWWDIRLLKIVWKYWTSENKRWWCQHISWSFKCVLICK